MVDVVDGGIVVDNSVVCGNVVDVVTVVGVVVVNFEVASGVIILGRTAIKIEFRLKIKSTLLLISTIYRKLVYRLIMF